MPRQSMAGHFSCCIYKRDYKTTLQQTGVPLLEHLLQPYQRRN